MDYGSIIKRAWHVTWRYKGLWVLGVFAGISGCQSGGTGGGGGGGSTGWRTNVQEFTWNGREIDFFRDLPGVLATVLPALVALAVFIFTLMLLWWILGIAARGGLVVGVSEIEEGRKHGLSALWGAGFKRFWSVLGLEILVGLPVLVATLIMLFFSFAPIFGPLLAGREPGAEFLAPMCGGLCVGVPVIIVLSLLLSVLRLIAMRYIMLGGQGAIEAIGNSWRFFRVRIKETVLMYLINAGLNIVAGIALVIPAVVISVAAVVPMVMAASDRNWSAITVPIAFLVFALFVLSLLYTGVWGTYTSALWTLFFRRVAGMEPAFAAAPSSDAGYPPPPQAPGQADYSAPVGPPIAGYSQEPIAAAETSAAPPAAPPVPTVDEYPPPPPPAPEGESQEAPPVIAPPDAPEGESPGEQE